MVDRRPSSGLVFRNADGTAYGGAVSPDAAELGSQVFRALTRLGFRETNARRVDSLRASFERRGTPQRMARLIESRLKSAIGDRPPR